MQDPIPSSCHVGPVGARSACLAFLLASAIGFAACGDSEAAGRARREAGDAVDATKDYAIEAWRGLATKAEPRIRELGDDLARLGREIEQRGEQASASAREAVRDAGQRLERAERQLADAKDSASRSLDETWSSIQAELERTGRSIENAWNELRKEN